jgi:hypothetical protein
VHADEVSERNTIGISSYTMFSDGEISTPTRPYFDSTVFPYIPSQATIELKFDMHSQENYEISWSRIQRNPNMSGFYLNDGFRFGFAQSSGNARLNVNRNDLDVRGYIRDYVSDRITPLYDRHLADQDLVSKDQFRASSLRFGESVADTIISNPGFANFDARSYTLPQEYAQTPFGSILSSSLSDLQKNEFFMRDVEGLQRGLRELDSLGNLSRRFNAYDLGFDYFGELGVNIGAQNNTRAGSTDLFMDWTLGVGATIFHTDQNEYFGCAGVRSTVGLGARNYINDNFNVTASIRGNVPITQKCAGGGSFTPSVNPTVFLGGEIRF